MYLYPALSMASQSGVTRLTNATLLSALAKGLFGPSPLRPAGVSESQGFRAIEEEMFIWVYGAEAPPLSLCAHMPLPSIPPAGLGMWSPTKAGRREESRGGVEEAEWWLAEAGEIPPPAQKMCLARPGRPSGAKLPPAAQILSTPWLQSDPRIPVTHG